MRYLRKNIMKIKYNKKIIFLTVVVLGGCLNNNPLQIEQLPRSAATAANGSSAAACESVSGTQYIYVADTMNNRIVRFTDITGNAVGNSSVNWITYGTVGVGVDELNQPTDIALDSQGRIYIADSANNRVVRIDDMCGTNWTTVTGNGGGDNITSPQGIAVMTVLPATNTIVITETTNRVVAFDEMTATNWRTFGSMGALDGEFNSPRHVYAVSDTQVLVADASNDRLQLLDVLGAGISWSRSYGSSGAGADNFSVPWGIGRSSVDNYYFVGDGWNARVVTFADLPPNPTFFSTVFDGATPITHGELLQYPNGVCHRTDTSGDSVVFVTDLMTHQVIKYNIVSGVGRAIGQAGGNSGSAEDEFHQPNGIKCFTHP